MIMPADELKRDNLALTEQLGQSVQECRKITVALELKIQRLYARNDGLEAILRRNNIAVPDWIENGVD